MVERGHPLYFDVAAVETGDPDMPISQALATLGALYATLDARLQKTTGHLKLPCYETCSDCCHESVFMTPLEFFYVVDHMQREWEPDRMQRAIDDGLRLYARHRDIIDKLSEPGEHTQLAIGLKFTCPLLGPAGCGVYPAREMLGRLFGQSFNDRGGVYGCHKSGAFFGGREATLVQATAWAKQLHALPLTGYRQVYPYYFHLVWGG